jgi:BirA family biotin operon repressor/biotin-[acetyl-CoA-carboxylase] ligase
MTLIERPVRSDGLDVLSLRLGLSAADVLDHWAPSRIRLKWPNDLKVGENKLAGILVEARWRGGQLDWVAIGFGLNVSGAPWPDAAMLAPGASRVEILEALVPSFRRAAAAAGGLTTDEIMRYGSRDWARGRRVVEPAVGVVAGISGRGALVIDTAAGPVERLTGSLIPAENTTDVAGL